MINADSVIALVLLLLTAALMFVFSLPQRTRSTRTLRSIPAFRRLRRALGLSVEEGKRIHVSLGRGNILDRTSASSLVGLSTLERIAQISMASDRPPVATSGHGTVALLSQDTLRAAYRSGNAVEQYDPSQARLSGPTSFSYAVGTIPVIRDERVSANILVGNIGPEAIFMTETAQQERAFTLAATDSLPGQAVIYASADEPLIGEELFALPAYLQAGPMHQASLRTQDVLRLLLVIALVVGAVLKIIAGLFGITFL